MANVLGIIGHGRIGTALGQVFTGNGWQVKYFDTKPHHSTVKSVAELAAVSDMLLIATPSWTNREIARQLLPAATGKLVVTVSKGVEPGFITMEEVLGEVAGGRFEHGVLHGPMLAGEIIHHKPAALIIATSGHRWEYSFPPRSLVSITYCDDPYSIALCGVLKNIFAVALGLQDGLELGNNSKGALAVRIIDEFQRLVAGLGGDPQQSLGLAGIGDLLTTGWSDQSFNYRMGRDIGRQGMPEVTKGEGVMALKELAGRMELEGYPVSAALYDIIFNNAEPVSIRDLV